MAKWFGALYNQEVRFSSAVKCKKEPQVQTSMLNQRRSYYYYYLGVSPLLYNTGFLLSLQGIELSDVVIEELQSKLFDVLKSIDVGKWVMTGVGAGVAAVGAGINFINPFSSKSIIPTI